MGFRKNHHLINLAALTSSLLLKAIKDLNFKGESYSVIDIGCGNGDILWLLQNNNYLKKAKITGLDIDLNVLSTFRKRLPEAKIIQGDIIDLKKLANNSFELVVANQVIEHLSDDKLLVKEAYRLLKRNGFLYVSSVLKKWYGIYWYRNRFGQIVVDPTHLREYKSSQQFENLFRLPGLKIKKTIIIPGKVCLGEYFLLLMKKLGLLNFSSIREYYFKHQDVYRVVSKTSFLPLPGYAIIEILCQKTCE